MSFDDETEFLRRVHEAPLTFRDKGQHGLQIVGNPMSSFYLNDQEVRREMRQHGRETRSVCFADLMDLDTFFERYVYDLERHPSGRAYGQWRNLLGRCDWWDLGGRSDGRVMGERSCVEARRTAVISSGNRPGRAILANVESMLRNALDHERPDDVEVDADRNIEMASTLLEDARAGQEHAVPGSRVLRPGSVTDHSRWIGS